jgi:hypothetical protein
VAAVTGAVLVVASVSVMDWARFSGSVGGSPRRSYGLRFLEMGDHLSIVDLGIAGAYFGGLGLLLAALVMIGALAVSWPGGPGSPAVRWLVVLLAVPAALLQVVVMASIGNAEGGVGPGAGAFVGLLGYAALATGAALGPSRRPPT